MRGIAVIDRQPNAEQIAVWVTNRDGDTARVSNTNAVVIDASGGADVVETVRALTRCCAVLATDGSTLDGLPIEQDPLTVADIAALLGEVETHRTRILDAIVDYKVRARGSSSLVEPTFSKPPVREDFTPSEETPTQRAFATADFVRRAWSTWLATDEERRRRTVQPKTGKTPWIMPEDMNGDAVPDFPEAFRSRLHVQPLV